MSTIGKTTHAIMSDGRHIYGAPTTRPVIDRITTRQARTRYKGEGVCLGAEVREFRGRFTGQVWAQAPLKGYWWIVKTDGSVVRAAEWELDAIGQAQQLDEPLFGESA